MEHSENDGRKPVPLGYRPPNASRRSRPRWWAVPLAFVGLHAAVATFLLYGAPLIHSSNADSSWEYTMHVCVLYIADYPVTVFMLVVTGKESLPSLPAVLVVCWLLLASVWWFLLGILGQKYVSTLRREFSQ